MTDSKSIKNYGAVSVVIATLGGPTLRGTIETLNQGSVVPDEILICIPQQEAPRVDDHRYPNVRVIVTSVRGQVAQRALGFREAKNDFVMQLDDDMSVSSTCVAQLVEACGKTDQRVAVAPALLDQNTGASVYKRPLKAGFISAVYFWLMNGSAGYVEGQLDKSGSAVGIDTDLSSDAVQSVGWLAGGCVMHRRENLVLENYWPLTGKAYYEDVVHSCILNKMGVHLLVDPRAKCSLEIVRQSSFTPKDFGQGLYRDYLARKFFMENYFQPSARLYFYYLTRILSYLYSRV